MCARTSSKECTWAFFDIDLYCCGIGYQNYLPFPIHFPYISKITHHSPYISHTFPIKRLNEKRELIYLSVGKAEGSNLTLFICRRINSQCDRNLFLGCVNFRPHMTWHML